MFTSMLRRLSLLSNTKQTSSENSNPINNVPVDINSQVVVSIDLPDGRFVSGSGDGLIQLWNTHGNDLTCIGTFFSPNSESTPIVALHALSATCLIVAYESDAIEIWNINAKVPIFMHRIQMTSSENPLEKLTSMIVVSNDCLVCGFSSGVIRVWDMASAVLVKLAHKLIAEGNLLMMESKADLPVTLLAAQGKQIISVHYPNDAKNTHGEMIVWQLDAQYRQLQPQGSPLALTSSERIDALLYLPDNLVVSSEGSTLSLSQLVQDNVKRSNALRSISSSSMTSRIDKLIGLSDTQKFMVVLTTGVVAFWQINLPERRVTRQSTLTATLNQIEAFDLSVSARGMTSSSAVTFLSNGHLVAGMQNSTLQVQKTSLSSWIPSVGDRFATETLSSSFPHIAPGDLTAKEYLGEGAFGAVYQAKLPNKISVALKEVHSKSLDDTFLEELKLHVQLSHNNIVAMHGAYQTDHFCLVMELMTGGDLFNKLSSLALARQPLPFEKRLQIAIDIANGLLYLHSLNIIHRDLKTENIFLNPAGLAKIADFGLAKKWDITTPGVKNLAGTPQYLAPEILLAFKQGNLVYSNKPTDVFAFAILLWDLASHGAEYFPCGAQDEEDILMRLCKFLNTKLRAPIPSSTPPGFAAVMTRTWSQRAEDRPTISEALDDLKKIRL